MKRALAIVTIISGLLSLSLPVAAQPKKGGATAGPKGAIVLADVKIIGRVQKPVAVMEIDRIRPKLALAEIRLPFVDRIEQAAYKEPF